MEQRWTLHEAEALKTLAQLPGESADALVADPPYSSGGLSHAERSASPAHKYVQHGTRLQRPDFFGDNRDGRSWSHWMTLWLSEAYRVIRPSGYALVFSDWRQLPLATDAFQAGGFVWRGLIVWDKTEGARAPHTGYFRHQAEFIVWGTKGRVPRGSGPWPGVLRHPVKHSDKHHMVGKPTALMRDLVRVVPVGGAIVDPFAGSGTTGVAALEAGRRFVGCELSAAYAAIARQRLREAEQAAAQRIAGGVGT